MYITNYIWKHGVNFITIERIEHNYFDCSETHLTTFSRNSQCIRHYVNIIYILKDVLIYHNIF